MEFSDDHKEHRSIQVKEVRFLQKRNSTKCQIFYYVTIPSACLSWLC
jgi:hypothetical protein